MHLVNTKFESSNLELNKKKRIILNILSTFLNM